MSNKTTIQSHNTRLNNLLEDINNLPEAGGIELPALDNEGASTDVLLGKQLINQNGEVVTGTMPNNGEIYLTIDGINTKGVVIPSGYTQGGSVSLDNTIGNEVTTQTDLIAQIAATVDGLPEADSGNSTNITYVTGTLADHYDSHPEMSIVLSNEIINVPATSSVTFQVIKNSYITVFGDYGAAIYASNGATTIVENNLIRGVWVYYVTDNFSLIVTE